jgi:hypothetical protein
MPNSEQFENECDTALGAAKNHLKRRKIGQYIDRRAA